MDLFRIFRPLTGCGTNDLVHSKSKAKKSASKPLRLWGGIFSPSNDVKDDASSFMSPMPNELYSRPSGDQCFLSPLNLDDTLDWSGDEYDSVRLSFIQCADIIDMFPATPPISRSHTLPSRHSKQSLPLTPLVHSRDFFNEREQDTETYHLPRRVLKKVSERSPTPLPLLFSQGPPPYSPPSMPFDMLTRTHMHHDNSPSHYESDLYGSPPDSLYALSTGLTSTQNSQQSLGSPLLLSPNSNMRSRLNTSSSSILIPNHLATSVSFQDLNNPTSSSSPPPSSPSSLRSVRSRVPGLERRLPGSPRRKFSPSHGSANPGEGHVPYGTARF